MIGLEKKMKKIQENGYIALTATSQCDIVYFMNTRFFENRMNQLRKGAIPITLSMCGFSDGILLSGICCGKQKPTMPPLRNQNSGAKKLVSRFRGNDSAAQELIPISVREYYEC